VRVLVFNAGSSSLKFGVFDLGRDERQMLKGTFDRFGPGGSRLRVEGPQGASDGPHPAGDIGAAIAAVPAIPAEQGLEAPAAVGHRLVHGGADHSAPVVLTDEGVAALDALTPLAPLHNPANLAGVRLARQVWRGLPQVAVFDAAFHATNPPRATTYAVPRAWRETGLRRYGFHGTSHKHVARRAAEALGVPVTTLQIVSCHLGNGASVCAIDRGRSVDSSMGMTPLEGLVMGTRSGDVDPGLFGHLHRTLGLTIPEIEAGLYEASGLKALAGTGDMREVEERAAGGDADAQLAIEVYAYRARKYIGAYAAAMGGGWTRSSSPGGSARTRPRCGGASATGWSSWACGWITTATRPCACRGTRRRRSRRWARACG
jgi:acetate kinase